MNQEPQPNPTDAVGLDDPNVEIQTFDRYKGRLNQTDRLAILSPSLLRVRTHYHEKIVAGKRTGKTFRCLSTPGKQAICCKSLGDSDQKFGMVLFTYLVDDQGRLVSTETLKGKVKLWIISETRYNELSNIHREFPLMNPGWGGAQFDLQAKCTEENFQRMQFTPCREAFWKKKQTWFDALMAKEAKARARLTRAIASDLSEADIMSFLEIDVPNPISGAQRTPSANSGGSGGVMEFDVDDVLS